MDTDLIKPERNEDIDDEGDQRPDPGLDPREQARLAAERNERIHEYLKDRSEMATVGGQLVAPVQRELDRVLSREPVRHLRATEPGGEGRLVRRDRRQR